MAAAAVMTEPARNLPATYPIEFLFDLDMVLSGADDFGCCQITTSDSLVADLPTVVADVCAVCLDDFRPDETGKQIPCGHVYHESCISSWLTVADCCPLCRCLVAGPPPDSPSIRRSLSVCRGNVSQSSDKKVNRTLYSIDCGQPL